MVRQQQQQRNTRRPAGIQHQPKKHSAAETTSQTPREDVLRFVPLGGLEEIGRNCAFFEYKNEIVIVDVGIQFPEEDTPGVDYIIPNVAYLEPRKQHIQGIIFTHGHYDHIHALPYVIEKLGNPVIYTAALTKAIIEKRFQEFPNLPKPRIEVAKNGDKVSLSEHFKAEFFDIGHTIPDALGFILDTPAGKMVHFGDFRLDMTKEGKPTNLEIFERLGALNIHSVFMDSTNARREGFSVSERVVEENLERLFREAKGRIIVATFSSMLTRIGEIIKIAAKLDRKVALNGRSMKDNVELARSLGYLKTEKGQVIPLEELNRHKDEKVLLLTTGAQGEPNAGLMRIVNGEHRLVALKKTDTVIFSSSVIPGNERSVQGLQDNIARQVDQIHNSQLLDIHTSGHCYSEDIKLVIKLTKPKFVIPVHAYYFMRRSVVKLAEAAGFPGNRVILMDNGQIAEITGDSFHVTNKTVPAFYVMVDGLGVGDVEEIVLRDRRMLAQEGMVVIIMTLNRSTGRLLKSPDVISRGFIYLKENKEILEEIRKRLRGIVGRIPNYQQVEADYLKTIIRDQIGQVVYNQTKRRPMILPVIIEI
ncbi:MAG: ribonuclease J [Candidatus Liptonbacteria bacterium]|nr:ribonuclease J [Candidatus Liptonbacteria bacterium]